MNKTISVFDLMLADEFKGWNVFDMIDLKNIVVVTDVLAQLGFDSNKAIYVYPANHRTMANEVRTGYIFCGTIAAGREHVHGKYATIHDMFAAAEMQNNGFYEELMNMSVRGSSYGVDNALDDKIPEQQDPEQRAEEVKILNEINQYAEILFMARGDQRKLDGSLKSLYDYLNPETPPKKRNKKKRNNTEGV